MLKRENKNTKTCVGFTMPRGSENRKKLTYMSGLLIQAWSEQVPQDSKNNNNDNNDNKNNTSYSKKNSN